MGEETGKARDIEKSDQRTHPESNGNGECPQVLRTNFSKTFDETLSKENVGVKPFTNGQGCDISGLSIKDRKAPGMMHAGNSVRNHRSMEDLMANVRCLSCGTVSTIMREAHVHLSGIDTAKYENIDRVHHGFIAFVDRNIRFAKENGTDLPYGTWQEAWPYFLQSEDWPFQTKEAN